MKTILSYFLFTICFAKSNLPLEKIKLPPGFKIEVLADGLTNARQMALSPKGILYVASMEAGNLYAIKNKKTYLIGEKYELPVGVVYHKGDLYFSAVSKILKIKNIDAHIEKPIKPEVIYDKLPSSNAHSWKYLAIGPDNKLYLAIGAPCNICEVKDPNGTLARMNLDGSGFEIIARGVRNSVGFTWSPDDHKLYFTDNGRDMMGEDTPPCEVNRLDKIGENFGFPYCHGGTVADPEFKSKPCSEFKAPVQALDAHVAPLGLKFYTGKKFPVEYRKLFIAEHGSWNRTKKSGYKILMLDIKDGKVIAQKDFATGWLDEKTQDVFGRPVDLLETPEGDLLVSDDHAHVVYKISYEKPRAKK